MARAATAQDRQKNLAYAERTLEKKLTDLKRLVTSIRLWQRRVKYYTQQVQMSDAERVLQRAEREQRVSAAAKRHRRIKL
jgi:hypothetical protein